MDTFLGPCYIAAEQTCLNPNRRHLTSQRRRRVFEVFSRNGRMIEKKVTVDWANLAFNDSLAHEVEQEPKTGE